MKCRKCGAEMPDGLLYCGKCRGNLKRQSSGSSFLFTKKMLPVWLGVLAAVALVVTGIFVIPELLNQAPDNPDPGNQDAAQITDSIKEYIGGKPETYEDMSYGKNIIQFKHSSTLDVLAQNACYEITKIQVDNDVADATLAITSPDIPAIMQEIMEEHTVSSSDELISLLEASLGESSLTKQYSVHITLKKVNGEWNLIENYDFLNAIYGGILEEGKQIINNATTDLTGGNHND